MIIINTKTPYNYIKIPYPSEKESDELSFVLKNTSTREEYYSVFEDDGRYNNFYSCNLKNPDAPKGEYEYTLGYTKGLLKII